jgi:hypothetical protein
MTIDKYGRVTHASNNTIAGTVSSVVVEAGAGINVTGGPITTTGTITVTNTGVTQLNAGPGINLSGSNGVVTVAATGGGGKVSQVSLSSNNLTITGSPITSIGTIAINMPDSPTFSGNVTVGNLKINGAGSNALYITGSANIAQDLRIGGNLYVPNLISVNSTTLNVQDPLLYLAANLAYPYSYDIGMYSHFATSGLPPGNGYQHTGLVRNHNNNIWYLFSNAAEPSGGTINFTDTNLKYDTLKLGNITSVANIISLNANLGNAVTANYFIGSGNNLSNIQGGNVSGQVGNALVAGTVYTNAQPNITSVGTLGNLTVTSNVTSSNANITTLLTASNANITTLLTASNANITGNITAGNANITTLLTASNANITGNITAGNANVTGNITVTNNANVSKVNATGNIIGANVNANTLVTAPQLVVSTTVPGTLYNGSIAMDSANNRLILVYNSTIHYINVTA